MLRTLVKSEILYATNTQCDGITKVHLLLLKLYSGYKKHNVELNSARGLYEIHQASNCISSFRARWVCNYRKLREDS